MHAMIVAPESAVPRFSGPVTPVSAGSRSGRLARCRRSGGSRSSPPRQSSRRGGLFLNNRYHDPALGSFISVDPLVTSTGQPYIYAGGNPTTYSDPSGLCPPNADCYEDALKAPNTGSGPTSPSSQQSACAKPFHQPCSNSNFVPFLPGGYETERGRVRYTEFVYVYGYSNTTTSSLEDLSWDVPSMTFPVWGGRTVSTPAAQRGTVLER